MLLKCGGDDRFPSGDRNIQILIVDSSTGCEILQFWRSIPSRRLKLLNYFMMLRCGLDNTRAERWFWAYFAPFDRHFRQINAVFWSKTNDYRQCTNSTYGVQNNIWVWCSFILDRICSCHISSQRLVVMAKALLFFLLVWFKRNKKSSHWSCPLSIFKIGVR